MWNHIKPKFIKTQSASLSKDVLKVTMQPYWPTGKLEVVKRIPWALVSKFLQYMKTMLELSPEPFGNSLTELQNVKMRLENPGFHPLNLKCPRNFWSFTMRTF